MHWNFIRWASRYVGLQFIHVFSLSYWHPFTPPPSV